MGIFDKLFGPKNPLDDLETKQYFEIICEMRRVFLSTGEENVVGNTRAKRYIEYFLGRACNEEKLKETLELYNRARNDYPPNKIDRLASDLRKDLYEKSKREKSKYYMDRAEAYKKFCPEIIDEAEVKYYKILDVIKDNVSYKYFAQGLASADIPETVVNMVLEKSFLEGNRITQVLVRDYLIDIFVARKQKESSIQVDSVDAIAHLALRALHFEKYGKVRDGYPSVNDSDYHNIVSSLKAYAEVINDNPFKKEEAIEKFARCIKKTEIFNGSHSTYRKEKDVHFLIKPQEDYFCDAACNLVWKDIVGRKKWRNDAGENISNSQNPSDVFEILWTYFSNPD